jgi:membrane protein YqaA with SNARE-associated domain
MDKPDQQDLQAEQPTEMQTIVRGANMLLMFWLPAVAAAVCLLAGIAKLDPVLLVMAGLGAVFAFLGWCFAQAD